MTEKAKYEHVRKDGETSFYFHQSVLPYEREWPLHFHPEIEISYIIKGSGIRIVGDRHEPFFEGEVIFIPSNMPHCWIYNPVNARNDQIKESLFVQLKPDLLSQGMMFFNEIKAEAERIMTFKQGLRLKGTCADNVRHIFVEMKTADNEQRLLLLFQLLLCIGKSEELEVVSCECHKAFICKKQEKLRKAFNYITNNYRHTITLNEISKAMAMSETSFSRFFRRETGESFIAFLNKYRICNVCSLLSNCPQLDINEAAWKCGFNDIPYFNRSFKKEKGMSPKAWRTQNVGIKHSI